MNYALLVNEDHPLPVSFSVKNLVSVGKVFDEVKQTLTKEEILLEKEAAKQLKKMLKAANAIDPFLQIVPNSGYRSREEQEQIRNYYIEKEGKEKAKKRVANPGTSEHQTGLAIDLSIFNHGIYQEEVTGEEIPVQFLYQNAHRYGFILRYPKGKEKITKIMAEPWHFRYVGIPLATYLHQNHFTLEEYWQQKKA